MMTTNYICKSCAHFLRDTNAFNAHMIAHGINVAEGFQVTEVGRSFGSGWSQITEKILTDKNFEFFRTTVTIQTRSRSGAIVRIGEQIGMAI